MNLGTGFVLHSNDNSLQGKIVAFCRKDKDFQQPEILYTVDDFDAKLDEVIKRIDEWTAKVEATKDIWLGKNDV